MFKVSPASLQTFIDTPNCVLEDRVQYSTVHIPNVFRDGHLQPISFVYCNRHVPREFLITLYYRIVCLIDICIIIIIIVNIIIIITAVYTDMLQYIFCKLSKVE